MHLRLLVLTCASLAVVRAESPDVLPEIAVYSPRVANQSPVATFAMPVSALRFEPRVDVQARNFAESQADVTIRGGIFENTGFSVGAVSLFDPQTGHYFAEIPVAPVMLGAPEIDVGADLAVRSTNATAGAVAYGWRPIRTAGAASAGAGEYGLLQAEFYQGYASDLQWAGQRVGADVAWAHSDANGSIPNGDHVLDRVNARVQFAGPRTQTDLFAGYQAKFFGWPNLYTPFNSPESENLKTMLLAVNHRVDLGSGDFVEAGAYYRRNRDDYAYNRFAPVGPVHPFNHTTWVQGAAVSGRSTMTDDAAVGFRAELLADDLTSTSLKFGHYHTRTIAKVAAVPEKTWTLADGSRVTARAGATYDDTNRNDGAVSPVIELSRREHGAPLERIYGSYAQTTQVPTYTALNSNPAAGLFRGNPDLDRETSHNLEAGLEGTWHGWTGQAAVFYRRDDDLVDWTFKQAAPGGTTPARTANAVDIATAGFEAVARHAWSGGELVLGYTWLGKDADYRGAAVDASFYALNYARHRLTAAITARLTRRLELRVDNELRAQAVNRLRTAGGNQAFLTAVGLTYRPEAWRRVTISVQVDNLWDSDFQDVPAVPAARRQTSALVGYTW